MIKYAQTALEAVRLIKEENISPVDAWEKAVKIIFSDSISSPKKGCQKNTFLGLCEEGKIKGVERGNYTNSKDNKRYALEAIKNLKSL